MQFKTCVIDLIPFTCLSYSVFLTYLYFPVLPVPSLFLSLPTLEVFNGLLHTLLVVADHVLVHVRVVGTDVLLCAAVWHCAKTKRRILLRRLLELYEKRRWAEIKAIKEEKEVKEKPTNRRETS